MSNNEKKKKSFRKFVKNFLPQNILKFVIVFALGAAAALGIVLAVNNSKEDDSNSVKVTSIGFEDIGELATQSARVVVVDQLTDDRELLGIKIPFTQTTYIYSYDVDITAGINFSEITWAVDEEGKQITVSLPEFRVLSCSLDITTLQVYYEKESIFTNITLEELNMSQQELLEKAQTQALEQGLLSRASENAQTMLTSFFEQVYDLDEYTLTFQTQEVSDAE